MCVRLVNHDDKFKILNNSSKLKGKFNARRRLYFIDEDLIDEDREQKKYMLELRKESRDDESDQKLKINIRKGKLFVNNEFVKQRWWYPRRRIY